MSSMKHFILVFDHRADKLILDCEFGSDVREATEFYKELEAEYRDQISVDVLLVGSDSLESVKVTHSGYFSGFSRQRIEHALGSTL